MASRRRVCYTERNDSPRPCPGSGVGGGTTDMEIALQTFLIVCPLVFLGSLVDAMVGGGGLISLPAYLIAGFPPHMATASNKCSAVFGMVFSTGRFLRQGKIHLPTAALAAGFALVGAALGARLNLILPDRYLHYVLVAALPVVAVFLLFKRDFGTENRMEELPHRRVMLFSAGIGFVFGMYDGFFGPGAGTFILLAFTGLVKMDLITASGNTKLINLASNVAAFTTFAFSGYIVWTVGLTAAAFGILGHVVGAGLALHKGAKIIRPMFFVVLTLLLLRVIWDLAATLLG